MSNLNSLPSDPYEKHSDNVYLVTKNYFSASKRLDLHKSASQWTLSFLSLGLIIIPLLTVTGIQLSLDEKVIDFASISLAVAVLTFSLLIGANNYSERALKLHQAGLELNKLLREIRRHSQDPNKLSRLEGFEEKYNGILDKYENVSQIDYIRGKLNIAKGSFPLMLNIQYLLLFSKEMAVYVVPLILEFGFIYILIY